MESFGDKNAHGEPSETGKSHTQQQLNNSDALFDALLLSDTVTVIENVNAKGAPLRNNDMAEGAVACSDSTQVNSSLSQLLDYGLSDSEDSQTDSDESLTESETNSEAKTKENDSSKIETQTVEFRGNDSSSDSSTTSEYEYESDSSSSFSDIGACGVTPAVVVPETKRPEKMQAPRTKGELDLDELPPIEELKISVPEEQCIEIGVVTSIIDQLVIVQSLKDIPAYDIDTLFFLNRGSIPLGRVFDVLGPVSEPFYAVRFNSFEKAVECGAKPGMPVYCAPQNSQHTSYVFVSELMKMKGSDASWEHNNEPPDLFLDYSDDEEERKARRMQRSKTLSTDAQKSNSLERNKKFEKQMNDKNLLMNERFKSQQAAIRKKKPPVTRGVIGGGPVMPIAPATPGGAMGGPIVPPQWVHTMHSANAPAPMPRAEFWSAPPFQFTAYPYGPLPVFANVPVQPPRQPFVPAPMMGGAPGAPPLRPSVYHGPPPQPFNPNLPPPIMRPQPVPYFPNPRHPRWLTSGMGVLQPPRGSYGNGSSYTQ